MSDSSLARPVVTEPEQHVAPARRRPVPAKRCCFCDRENAGDVVDAGGDIGRVHRACFIAWDREQEALELAMTMALSLPDPREAWTERELEAVPVARAA